MGSSSPNRGEKKRIELPPPSLDFQTQHTGYLLEFPEILAFYLPFQEDLSVTCQPHWLVKSSFVKERTTPKTNSKSKCENQGSERHNPRKGRKEARGIPAIREAKWDKTFLSPTKPAIQLRSGSSPIGQA